MVPCFKVIALEVSSLPIVPSLLIPALTPAIKALELVNIIESTLEALSIFIPLVSPIIFPALVRVPPIVLSKLIPACFPCMVPELLKFSRVDFLKPWKMFGYLILLN